jgi:hypothetical protein
LPAWCRLTESGTPRLGGNGRWNGFAAAARYLPGGFVMVEGEVAAVDPAIDQPAEQTPNDEGRE